MVSSEAEIRLGRTKGQFEALEAAEETRFLPGARGQRAYGQDQMLSWPYGLGMGGVGMGVGPRSIISDRAPAGEVEVRRGDTSRRPTAPSERCRV